MRALLASALVLASLGGCGTGERRPDPVAGTFRMSNAVHGESRVLALVASGDDVAFARLVDVPSGVADGGALETEGDAGAIADWRFTSFGQGLYRIDNVATDGRLSLAAGYGSSSSGIELAPSRKSAFQLWNVVPLADGFCRLTSALFPEASLDADGDAAEEGREPRLSRSTDDASGQRWRFAPLADTVADGLPSLCTGVPR